MTESEQPPARVDDIDVQLRSSLNRFHRVRWTGLGGILALLIAAAVLLGVTAMKDDSRLRASCGFWYPLSTIPVVSSASPKPAALTVQIVGAARTAYIGQGCGRLPAATEDLLKWEEFYHLPLTR